MITKTLKLSEKEIQNMVISHLQIVGYYVQRLNAGGYKTQTGYVKGVAVGTPDIMAIKDGKCLFIEVKREGKDATVLQKLKMEELARYGAKCLVIHSLEELEKELLQS